MTLRSDFTGPTGIHIMASRPVEVWVSPTKSPNDASHYYGVTTAGYIEMPRQPGPWYVICAVPKDCAYYSDLEIIAQPLCPW